MPKNDSKVREFSDAEYEVLAEFRHQIAIFLRRRTMAAKSAGLEPKQYQLMLAVKGFGASKPPTIGELATQLQLYHHSTVELVNRLERQGYIQRHRSTTDKRVVQLTVTPAGQKVLDKLVAFSLTELKSEGPALIRSLQHVLKGTSGKKRSSQRQTVKSR